LRILVPLGHTYLLIFVLLCCGCALMMFQLDCLFTAYAMDWEVAVCLKNLIMFGTLCLPRWHLRSACGMNRSLTYNTILFTLSADIMGLADE